MSNCIDPRRYDGASAVCHFSLLVFWDDLQRDLEDPEYRRAFFLEQNRVSTVDRVMNQLIEALEKSGLTRSAVASAIDSQPSAVRRLLNQETSSANPTLRTLTDVAAVLGYKIDLVPLKGEERKRVAEAIAPTVKPEPPTNEPRRKAA
jgi:transcriptional regulator with XRE-family HTH domain